MRRLSFMLLSVLLTLPLGRIGADEGSDMLLFSVQGEHGEQTELVLYDPATQQGTPLPTELGLPKLSTAGLLAYTVSVEGEMEVHVRDTRHPDKLSVAVIDIPFDNQYPLSWSPDGHTLAFQSYRADDPAHPVLYVWDGETTVDITPQDGLDEPQQYDKYVWSPDGHSLAFVPSDGNGARQVYVWDRETLYPVVSQDNVYDYQLAWSPDGRLAIGVSYYETLPTAIYVWDRYSTMPLSEYPTQNSVWSADGRLAFLSQQDGYYNLLVWDGVSVKDGQPDADTFVNVAPELTKQYSIPVWTSLNQVAFAALSMNDRYSQIYVWDGSEATNISRNPDVGNDKAVWSADGHWSFVGYDPSDTFVYVRDRDNLSALMTKGGGSYTKPAWSLNGDLMFCRWDQEEWVLVVWNGQDVLEIARGPHVRAQWQSGPFVDCFSG